MKISENVFKMIEDYWDKYIENGKVVIDLKGGKTNADDFDNLRTNTAKQVLELINTFLEGKIDLQEFKVKNDGLNKRFDYWGFSAIKGQMFFNQLINVQENKLDSVTLALKEAMAIPDSIQSAKKSIDALEDFVTPYYTTAKDKRKSPKPTSIPYFLSYFWQIFDPVKWPIYYTSTVEMLKALEIWEEHERQSDNYEYFFEMMNHIKNHIQQTTEEKVSHWAVEHCIWWNKIHLQEPPPQAGLQVHKGKGQQKQSASFQLWEYIPPIVADLIDAGNQKEGGTGKGYHYEQQVALVFQMLDFEIKNLGQGKGRSPDAIATYRNENTAFLIDAKVRPDGYAIGTDDRAIKEYISRYLNELKNDGYKKSGFVIVSTSFKGDPKKYIDEITLETDLKRFVLITSEALLYLLAYKIKGIIGTVDIAEFLLQNGVIEANHVVESFQDI